jgi:3-phenylpropionate/trans-cinnamate dioxygenase ferredoxin reductase subunit
MVIIGGGECGARAALALREAGHGGPVTVIGAEPYLPYERPPLSKEALVADEESAPKTIATAERLAAADITVLIGTAAKEIDPEAHTVALADRTAIAYDKLLIATGAESRHLPLAGPPTRRIAYLRTFDEALHIRRALGAGRHIVIIGGGFIGLEVAAGARRRGSSVTVIEALPRVLSRVVPEEIASVVDARHRSEGVTVHCDVGVARIEEGDDSVAVNLSDGQRLSADFLVIGIGAVPVVDIAEVAGLPVADGIVVDEHLRTRDPNIYAAGDCCSFPLAVYGGRRVRLESWRNAQEQGALAARNMLGANEPISAVPWFWSDQYDLTLQIAGLPDEGEVTIRREWADGLLLFHLKADGRLVAAAGLGVGNAVARDIRVAEMLVARRARPRWRNRNSGSSRFSRHRGAPWRASGRQLRTCRR